MNISDMYVSGFSIPEIAAVMLVPRSTVRNRLISVGVKLRTRAEALKIASDKGRLGSGLRGKKRKPFSKAWKDNIKAARLEHSKAYAKGLTTKPNGYVEYTKGPNKGRSQHVVIAEEIIGRRLFAHECVHHKNGKRNDNSAENLQVMTRSAHASHHAREASANRCRTKHGRFK